jgi:nucleotide-binding universal stress UspA family protein
MLDHILIPTDGTELSARAAAFGIQLAKKMAAKVTAVTVTTPAKAMMLGEVSLIRDTEEYEERTSEAAGAILDVIGKLAAEASVPCEKLHVRSESTWHGILEAANSRKTDMIVMASHGRRGLSAMVIGSETQKVVNHSHIPVTIYRER